MREYLSLPKKPLHFFFTGLKLISQNCILKLLINICILGIDQMSTCYVKQVTCTAVKNPQILLPDSGVF